MAGVDQDREGSPGGCGREWGRREVVGQADAGNEGNAWLEVVELAAIAGIDPWPLTLRELHHAAIRKLQCDWDHTAELLAMLANVNSQTNFTRNQFHPFRDN